MIKAMFLVCDRIGNGQEITWTTWFSGLAIKGWSGSPVADQYVSNVFSEDQGVLDAIANDPRTEFSFPIDIDGTEMSYSDAFEIPPFTRGKLIAWCAKTYGAEFGQAVAANAKNRRFVAETVMRKVSGVPDADPLNGWRVHWT